MGSIATPSPHRPLSDSLVIPNQALPGVGTPLTLYKYSGAVIDIALPGDGGPSAPTWPTVPTDAVALELWSNTTGATDYLFAALAGGRLSNTGVLGTNNTANLLACRYVTAGAHMVLPLSAVGGSLASYRVAAGTATTRMQGRFISQSALFPYLQASGTEIVLTGGGVFQLPFSDSARFPPGYSAAVIQILGPGPVRMTVDGSPPSATLGDVMATGTYLIDFARMGISITALRFFIPAGTNIVGNSLKAGA